MRKRAKVRTNGVDEYMVVCVCVCVCVKSVRNWDKILGKFWSDGYKSFGIFRRRDLGSEKRFIGGD